MFSTYNKKAAMKNIESAMLQSYFGGNNIGHAFVLQIRREQILKDSLSKIVNISDSNKLKLPLRVIFENEPGIDEGGVSKEYFQLVLEELFDPQFNMFKFNEDTRLYWFNGQTFEANINFELIGTLMGLATYNNLFLNVPIAPACYKLLLDWEPDLEDMRKWKPDVGKSLEFILEYNEETPLEDVIARTFTISVESFDSI